MEDDDLWPGQGQEVECRPAARALAHLSGWVSIPSVTSPCFSRVAWVWETGVLCLLDMPESFSQFGLRERPCAPVLALQGPGVS